MLGLRFAETAGVTSSLPAVASAQGGIFSAADARAHGYDRNEAAHLLASGQWTLLSRGVYAVARADGDAVEMHRLDVRAAQLRVSGAVASHSSAAVLLGMSLLKTPSVVTLTSDRADHRRRSVLHVLRAPLPDHHVRVDGSGVPVTTGGRTAVDVGRTLPFLDVVVALDSALRLGLCNSALPEALAFGRAGGQRLRGP